MAGVKDTLLNLIAEPERSSGNKVTIVGVGQVGMACAFSILTQVILYKILKFYKHLNLRLYFLECIK